MSKNGSHAGMSKSELAERLGNAETYIQRYGRVLAALAGKGEIRIPMNDFLLAPVTQLHMRYDKDSGDVVAWLEPQKGEAST